MRATSFPVGFVVGLTVGIAVAGMAALASPLSGSCEAPRCQGCPEQTGIGRIVARFQIHRRFHTEFGKIEAPMPAPGSLVTMGGEPFRVNRHLGPPAARIALLEAVDGEVLATDLERLVADAQVAEVQRDLRLHAALPRRVNAQAQAVTARRRRAGRRCWESAPSPFGPFFPCQWAFENTGRDLGTPFPMPDIDIDFGAAHAAGWTGAGVRIGLVDSIPAAAGVDFSPRRNLGGTSFVKAAAVHPHGEYALSVMAADLDADHGVGVASGAEVYAWRVLDDQSAGVLSDLVEALEDIRRATPRPRVVNLSLEYCSGKEQAPTVRSLFGDMADVLFVVAAGNRGCDLATDPSWPAAFGDLDNVIAVASVDGAGTLSSDSNWGSTWVAIAAPGERIFVPDPDPTKTTPRVASGTSMAAPHVTGLAALVFGACPSRTASEVKAAIIASAKPLWCRVADRSPLAIVRAPAAIARACRSG